MDQSQSLEVRQLLFFAMNFSGTVSMTALFLMETLAAVMATLARMMSAAMAHVLILSLAMMAMPAPLMDATPPPDALMLPFPGVVTVLLVKVVLNVMTAMNVL